MNAMTYEVDGRIARITLNRPDRGNGITLDLPVELKQCVEKAVRERDEPFGDFGPSTHKG